MDVVRTVFLNICIAYMCSRIWFGFVYNLAVNVLLGTRHIDKVVKGTFLMNRQVLHIHSKEVTKLVIDPTTPGNLGLEVSHHYQSVRLTRKEVCTGFAADLAVASGLFNRWKRIPRGTT